MAVMSRRVVVGRAALTRCTALTAVASLISAAVTATTTAVICPMSSFALIPLMYEANICYKTKFMILIANSQIQSLCLSIMSMRIYVYCISSVVCKLCSEKLQLRIVTYSETLYQFCLDVSLFFVQLVYR